MIIEAMGENGGSTAKENLIIYNITKHTIIQ